MIYYNEDMAGGLEGAETARVLHLHGPGIDEPLSMGRPTGTFVYHADGLGSITHLTSTTGAVARSYTYDSFGRLVAQTGTFSNPYTYTGRELDPESGLYYYRARYYDMNSGRFLTEDPIRFDGGSTNFYGYVGNNPIRFVDPLELLAFGITIDLSTINPFTSTGGGTYGINLQYTSDAGWDIYVLGTPNNVQSVGFEVGLSATFNFALGRGDWTGPFDQYTGSWWIFQGGFFHTSLEDPNPGYSGVQFGGALGFPGVGATQVNYQTLSDFLKGFGQPRTVCSQNQ